MLFLASNSWTANHPETPSAPYATRLAACTAYAHLLLHKIWKHVWKWEGEGQPLRIEGEGGPPSFVQKWWSDFWRAGPSCVAPGLFVGSAVDAADAPGMAELGVELVVNATADIPNFFEGVGCGAPEYVRVPMVDGPNATFQEHISATRDALCKIKQVRGRGGAVLVHCLMGASRSVTLACLAIMDERECGAEDAYNAVKSLRNPARINVSFMEDLRERSAWI